MSFWVVPECIWGPSWGHIPLKYGRMCPGPPLRLPLDPPEHTSVNRTSERGEELQKKAQSMKKIDLFNDKLKQTEVMEFEGEQQHYLDST